MSNNDKMREAVGIFNDNEKLNVALNELEKFFPKQAFSVIGTQDALEEKLGKSSPSPKSVIADDDVPHHVPVKPEEKTVISSAAIGGSAYAGAAAAALALAGAASLPITIAAAAVVGIASGSAGAFLVKMIGDENSKEIEEQIEAGGLLLWVGVQSKEDEGKACQIMKENGATYAEVHTINA